MCVIVVCENRKMTAQELSDCFICDSDGAGFAFAKNNKVHYQKGFMTLTDLTLAYDDVPNDVPHVVHFRTQTSGGKKAELTHPFLVSKTSPLRLKDSTSHSVLFHNGIYSEWQTHMVAAYTAQGRKIPNGHWSDTRLAAIMVNNLGEEAFRIMSGKWVRLTRTGNIYVYGDFVDVDGLLCSNSRFKTRYDTWSWNSYYNKGYKDYSGYSVKVGV